MFASTRTSSDLTTLKKDGELMKDSAQLEAVSNVSEWVHSSQPTNTTPETFSWSFYYDEGGHSKNSKNNQRSNMVKLGSFLTVESFWTYFNTLDKSLDRICKSGKFNLRLFKSAIQPHWQDQSNVNGGKWVIGCRMESIERVREMWNELVLATIGSKLPSQAHLCGVALAQRDGQRELQIWVDSDPFTSTDTASTSTDPDVTQRVVTDNLRNALRLPISIDLKYHSHQSLMSRRLDLKRDNKRIVKVSHKQIKAQTWPDDAEQGESKLTTRDVESLDVKLNIGSDGRSHTTPSTPVPVSTITTASSTSSTTPPSPKSAPVVSVSDEIHAFAPAPLDEEIDSGEEENNNSSGEHVNNHITVSDVASSTTPSPSTTSAVATVIPSALPVSSAESTPVSTPASAVSTPSLMAPIIAEMQQLQIRPSVPLPTQHQQQPNVNNNNNNYPSSSYNNNNNNNYHSIFDQRRSNGGSTLRADMGPSSSYHSHRRHSQSSDDSDDSDDANTSASARQYLAAQGHPSPGALVKALLATVGDGSPAALAAAAAALIPDSIPRALARSMRKKARRKLNRLKRKRLMQLQQMAKDGLIPQSAIPTSVQAVSLTRPLTALPTTLNTRPLSYSTHQPSSNNYLSSSSNDFSSNNNGNVAPSSPLLVTSQPYMTDMSAATSSLTATPAYANPTGLALPMVYPSTYAGQIGYVDPNTIPTQPPLIATPMTASASSSSSSTTSVSVEKTQQQSVLTSQSTTSLPVQQQQQQSAQMMQQQQPTVMATTAQEYMVIPEQQFATLYNYGVDMYGYQYMYDPYSQQMVYLAPLQSIPALQPMQPPMQPTLQPTMQSTIPTVTQQVLVPTENGTYVPVLRPIPYVAYQTPAPSVTSSRRSSASVHPERAPLTAAPATTQAYNSHTQQHNRELLRTTRKFDYPQQPPLLQPTTSLRHMTPAQALVAMTPSHPSQLLQATAATSVQQVSVSSSPSHVSNDADKYQRQYNKMQEKRKQYRSYDNVKDNTMGCFIPHPDVQPQ